VAKERGKTGSAEPGVGPAAGSDTSQDQLPALSSAPAEKLDV
jgi:hypothetical protein